MNYSFAKLRARIERAVRRKEVRIKSRDYWFKIVEFLQQNWALVDPYKDGAIAWFIGDTSVVFDKIVFSSQEEASRALTRNGFRRFSNDQEAQTFLRAPKAPFLRGLHPNGAIYSSGRSWK